MGADAQHREPAPHHDPVMFAIHVVDKRVDQTNVRVGLIEDEMGGLRGMEQRLMSHVQTQLSPLAQLLAESAAAKKRQERTWKGVQTLLTVCGGSLCGVAFKFLGWL